MLPTNRLLLLLVASLLLPLAALLLMLVDGPIQPAALMLPAAILLNGSLLAFALRDIGWLLRWRRSRALIVKRQIGATLAQGSDSVAVIIVENHARRPIRVEINDTLPDGCQLLGDGDDLPLRTEVAAGTRIRLSYGFVPLKRGSHVFGDIYVRIHGPLGLVSRQFQLSQYDQIKVLPDIQAAHEGRMLMSRLGHNELTRRSRLRGEVGQFHHLREYVPGDDARLIDWKATARRRDPVVRTFEPQRNQNVLILLDCGRLMTGEIGRLTKFDWGVRAALGIGGAAIAAGDLVGMLVFSRQVSQYLAPGKGQGQLRKMADLLARADTDLMQADYHAAFAHAAQNLRRRSLILLITDLGSGADRHDLVRAVGLVLPRHLTVLATIADPALSAIAQAVPPEETSLFEVITADEILEDTENVRRNLQSRGVLNVQAPAGNLLERSVQAYLDIKQRGRL